MPLQAPLHRLQVTQLPQLLQLLHLLVLQQRLPLRWCMTTASTTNANTIANTK